VPSIAFAAARRALILPLILGAALLCVTSTARSQVVRWDIEGTIIEIEDPQMFLPEVRLGDPVRGFLTYNLATTPDNSDPNPNSTAYIHEPTFPVIGMVIENPRDGTEVTFTPFTDPVEELFGAIVEIFNNEEDASLGMYDEVLGFQPVVPPDGQVLLFPAFLGLDLFGPPDVLDDTSLPLELNLGDWPDATIVYIDLFAELFIVAEIHTLTPGAPPAMPGDFNDDGKVDAADYQVWQAAFGSTTDLAADGNGDGVVDAADYVVWRGASDPAPGAARAASTLAAVPEPTNVALLVIGVAMLLLRRRGCR
jgi:hypothetical protein